MRKPCPFTGQTFDVTAEVPRFPSFASFAQQAFADTIWEEGISSKAPQVTVERIRQRQGRKRKKNALLGEGISFVS